MLLNHFTTQIGAGLFSMQLDMIIHHIEGQHLAAAIDRTLDVRDIFVQLGAVWDAVIIALVNKGGVSFRMEAFHVLKVGISVLCDRGGFFRLRAHRGRTRDKERGSGWSGCKRSRDRNFGGTHKHHQDIRIAR